MLARYTFGFFLYLIFEGAFRKWLFPGFSKELFLLKDLFLAAGAFSIFGLVTVYRNPYVTRVLYRRDRLIWGLWCFFFIGHLFTSGIGLSNMIGLRYYLIMLPILIMLPAVIRDIDHLNSIALKYYYLSIPICILGLIQFVSPPTSWINAYAWSAAEMAVSTLGENSVRITGTFSYIAPYAIYLQCMLLVGLCLYLKQTTTRARLVISASFVLIFTNIAMTGSRGPFLMATILAVPFLFEIFKSREIRRFSTILSLLLMACLIFFYTDPFSQLAERQKGSGDTESRIVGALSIPLYTLKNASFEGKGVGSTFGGMEEATGSRAEDSGFEEIVIDRIGIEVGILGFLFVLLVKLFYLVETFRFYRRTAEDDLRLWTLASFSCQLSMLWTIPIYNSLAAAYYFASLAIFFKLREIAKYRTMETVR